MIVTEKAPAKLNLSLGTPMRYLGGSLQWGVVVVSIGLADYVTVKTHRRPIAIKVYTNSGFLPNDQRNLACQTAHILRSRLHYKDDVTIRIKKQIPVAAGLGSGFSDVAAVLRALNSIWRLGLNLSELAKTTLTINSDVPYCIYSKLARAVGRSKKIELLPPQPYCWVVITKQEASVSTLQVLRQVNYERFQHLNDEALLINLEEEDWQEATKYIGGVLEPLAMKLYPEVSRLKNKMKGLGTDIAQMSGMGPAVLAICHTES